MPRHVSVATAIEKNKIVSDTPIILLLEIDVTNPNTRVVEETLYIARNDEPVIYRGNSYQPGNFMVNVTNRQGETLSVSIDVTDPTGYVSSRVEAYAGGVRSAVRMLVVNTARLAQEPEIEESFEVLNASVKDFNISFEIGVPNPLNVRYPRRKQFRNRCSWRFKGTGCGYAGPDETCSYTYDGANGCVAKGNGKRFGGFRGLRPLNI